jgi:hypothetical protein
MVVTDSMIADALRGKACCCTQAFQNVAEMQVGEQKTFPCSLAIAFGVNKLR